MFVWKNILFNGLAEILDFILKTAVLGIYSVQCTHPVGKEKKKDPFYDK